MGRSGSTDTDTDTLHLEVNDAGGWRRVMSFEKSSEPQFEGVLVSTHQLLRHSANPRLRARIIAPGTTAPLMTWTHDGQWQNWSDR